MTRDFSLYWLLFIAFLGWCAALLFTRFVPPHSMLAFAIFFLILGVSLISTLAPLIYAIEQHIFPKHHAHLLVSYALRQSLLFALAIILNLLFLALHSWNVIMALVIVLAAIILEILFMARK